MGCWETLKATKMTRQISLSKTAYTKLLYTQWGLMFFRGKGQGKQSSPELSEELKKYKDERHRVELYKPFLHWCYCETLHLLVYQGLCQSLVMLQVGTLTEGEDMVLRFCSAYTAHTAPTGNVLLTHVTVNPSAPRKPQRSLAAAPP